jgi:hypothetical protein
LRAGHMLLGHFEALSQRDLRAEHQEKRGQEKQGRCL